MRKSILLLALMTLFAACTEPLTPEGEIVTQTRTFDINSYSLDQMDMDIVYLYVTDGIELFCDESLPGGTIEITTHENIQPYVEINNHGQQSLSIGLNDDYEYNSPVIKMRISPNQFNGFMARQGSKMIFKQPIERDLLTMRAWKGSYFEAAGSCRLLLVDIYEGSELQAPNLTAADAEISVGDDCVMSVGAVDHFQCWMGVNAKLYYSGDPMIEKEYMQEGSEVIKR